MHDHWFGSRVAPAIGYTWYPWATRKGLAPTKKWIHVTAVFRQSGASYVYLNGVKSENSGIGRNNDGLGDLRIGCLPWDGHWRDCWVKEVKVWNRALNDDEVTKYYTAFQASVTPRSLKP